MVKYIGHLPLQLCPKINVGNTSMPIKYAIVNSTINFNSLNMQTQLEYDYWL
jgi:hypothetical protein